MDNQRSTTAWNRLLKETSSTYRPSPRALATSIKGDRCGHGSCLGEGAHMSDHVYKQLGIAAHIWA